MKFPAAGTKAALPSPAPAAVARQDSKFRRFKKEGSDEQLPVHVLQGKPVRCAPIRALLGGSAMVPRRLLSKSCVLWLTISLLLGLVALVHVGSLLTSGHLFSRICFFVVKMWYLAGREWRRGIGHLSGHGGSNYTYPGPVPPFVPVHPYPGCEGAGAELPAVFGAIANGSSAAAMAGPDFDVCLMVSIGDDGDGPSERALPYGLVSRLIDAAVEEAGRARAGREWAPEAMVKVLVGVDYGSVVCRMVRDAFAETAGADAQCQRFAELPGAGTGTKCGTLVAGRSARFVPQLPERWYETLEWRAARAVELDCADPRARAPAIPEAEWRPTVVTGFSSNHLTVGLLMLRSVGQAARAARWSNVSVVVWAMEEFDAEHKRLLECVISELNVEYGVRAESRLFDWAAHPAWMRINHDLGYFGGTGEYAWKAVMVHTVLVERGMVLWGDAGDRFLDAASLVDTFGALSSSGFVSRNSHGYVFTRTHSRHLKFFRANVPEIYDRRNCEAAVAGFTLKKYAELARPWYDCSLTRQCIAPDGSDRSNHRQDQAALTLLSILSRNPCSGVHPKFADHLDDDPKLKDTSGTYVSKCYADPLILSGQGTHKPADRPHGIIN